MNWIDFYKKELGELKQLLKSQNKVLVQHRDVDGSCCAAQFLKFYPDFRTFSIKDPFIPDDLMSELKVLKPELIIFVDVGVDEHADRLEKLKDILPETKFFIVDHHMIQNDLSKKGMVHINPRFQDPEIYIPASLMVFDILSYFGLENKKDSWLACIGVISDYGQKDNPEFIEACKKMYPGLLDSKELIDSTIGDSAKTIYSGIILKGEYGVKKVLDALVKAGKFEDFSENKTLNGWRQKVDKEIEKVVKDSEDKKEILDGILFFEIKSKLNLASIISNILSRKYEDKIVVISKHVSDGWKISARSPKNIAGKKLNLAEAVKKSVEGIGYGGGHPQAAGAFVEDWEKFKERLTKLVQ